MSTLRFHSHLSTGTATGVGPASAASAIKGSAIDMGGSYKRVFDLGAMVTVDAETNTLTLTARWLGSNDASTWFEIANGSQNAAGVALATGTGGADASVSRFIPAPDGAYSYRYASCALLVGVATGTDSDTWSIAYSYRQANAGGEVL